MKLDPVLLNMAASWSQKAYNNKNKDAIKIENKFTGATAFVVKRKTIDVIVFRGTQKTFTEATKDERERIQTTPTPIHKPKLKGKFQPETER